MSTSTRAAPTKPPSRLARWLRIARTTLRVAAVVVVTVLGVRAYDASSGPPLERWHTFVPEEPSAAEIDASDWSDYLRREALAFEAVENAVVHTRPAVAAMVLDRYAAGSRVHRGALAHDWNRSFVLDPPGTPAGVAVLLHGLSDSPYSLRHLAAHYRDRGWRAVVIRLPGHGTVPAALTDVGRDEWLAATRLAVREATRALPADRPLHVVGYSNGAALALQYAAAARGRELRPPTRLVLLSPMIGVDAFARFAGLAAAPAVLPPFAAAAWLDRLPEYNPFKYNSFPVRAAREAYALARDTQSLLAAGGAARLPPVLTFQSVLDATVDTRAVVVSLYDRLPANRSELVLFDVHRAPHVLPMLRRTAAAPLETLLTPSPRPYAITVVGGGAPAGGGGGASAGSAVARTTPAGASVPVDEALAVGYPADVYSLSHVAIPFPVDDPLYGRAPADAGDFGVVLGAAAPRGERGALVVGADALLRISWNPFFPYLLRRLDAAIDADGATMPAPASAALRTPSSRTAAVPRSAT